MIIYHVILCYLISLHLMSPRLISCHAMLSHVILSHHISSHHISFYPILSLSIPSHFISSSHSLPRLNLNQMSQFCSFSDVDRDKMCTTWRPSQGKFHWSSTMKLWSVSQTQQYQCSVLMVTFYLSRQLATNSATVKRWGANQSSFSLKHAEAKRKIKE